MASSAVLSLVPLLALLGAPHVGADFPSPEYTLDLDRPAAERWGPVLEAHLKAHDWNWDETFGPALGFLTSVMPMSDWEKHDKAFQALGLALFGLEYTEELRGIYATASRFGFGKKVTTGQLVFFQLFYELIMECSGALARDASGHVVHGRNLDIGGLTVGNITAQVNWIKGGKKVMVTTQFLGYTGVHTGMRPGAWSVQSNERVVLEPGPWGWTKTTLGMDIAALAERHQPVGFLLREALLGAPTYAAALTRLSEKKSVSPLYFIVAGAGPNEAAVITRNREGLAQSPGNENVLQLKDSKEWFLAQTNWDNWIPIDREQCAGTVAALPKYARLACKMFTKYVFGDDNGCGREGLCKLTSDGRFEALTASLKQLGGPAAVNFESVLGTLSKAPVLNGGTLFTSLMDPSTGAYKTVVRTHGAGEDFQQEPLRRAQGELAAELVRALLRFAATLEGGALV